MGGCELARASPKSREWDSHLVSPPPLPFPGHAQEEPSDAVPSGSGGRVGKQGLEGRAVGPGRGSRPPPVGDPVTPGTAHAAGNPQCALGRLLPRKRGVWAGQLRSWSD